MTLLPFTLVFISVFLHATWNFLSKKANPSGCYYMLSTGTASAMWAVFLILSPIPFRELPVQFWMFYLISTVGETLYMLGLAYGYRHSDISLIYPAGRSLPVIGVALCTVIFGLGEVPGKMAMLGMGIITFGALLLPQQNLKDLSWRRYWNRNLIYILMIASGTTLYTIFDSEAMKHLKKYQSVTPLMRALSYLFFVEFGVAVAMFIKLIFDRKEQEEFKRLVCSPYPYLTGICSSLAYLLILLAMPMVSNVSYIQAFRQMSLPLGVLAGVFFLKEKLPPMKIAGILLIMTGLLMTVKF